MIKSILLLIGVVILIVFGYFYLTKKIRMTKIMLMIIGVISLLAFAYFTRIDGYRGSIEQFSSYKTIQIPTKFFDSYTKILTKI